MTITLQHYLILSLVLFSIGAVGVVTRNNLLIVLMSIELMLSAANISLLAFARWNLLPEGKVVALFIIAIAAAGVAVGLALAIAMYKTKSNLNLDGLKILRG